MKRAAMWIYFHTVLKHLIKHNYRLRAEGELPDAWYWADEQAAEYGYFVSVDKGHNGQNSKESIMIRINLGDEVKDPITGTQGIAVCRHSYLHGCDRIQIQPKSKEDGTYVEPLSFDEPQLIIIMANKVKSSVADDPLPSKRGGPQRYTDTPR